MHKKPLIRFLKSEKNKSRKNKSEKNKKRPFRHVLQQMLLYLYIKKRKRLR